VNTALYAQRIVQAWERFEFSRFETELECALRVCNSSIPVSEVESEETAVLESVVRQFRQLGSDDDDSYRLGAGFFLLRHLQAR
jgi:hypothetical protein